MSASLVGSEMCIRDRIRRRQTLHSRRRNGRTPAPGAPVRVRRAPSHSPVSYTHLTLPTICSV
eukprot:3632666-Alexandrium_andersonii.AAC.1